MKEMKKVYVNPTVKVLEGYVACQDGGNIGSGNTNPETGGGEVGGLDEFNAKEGLWGDIWDDIE